MKQSSASCSQSSRSNLPTHPRRKVIAASRPFFGWLSASVGIVAEIYLLSVAAQALLDLCWLSPAAASSALEARSLVASGFNR